MKRLPQSHKGENGSVLIVGGNELFHGAPILAALAAEKSGADLVYLMVPRNQQHLARSFSPGLIVDTFSGRFLRPRDVQKIQDYSKKVDVILIGNGLGTRPQTKRALVKCFHSISSKLVVDAQALQTFSLIAPLLSSPDIVLTPHRGEFLHMTGISLEDLDMEEQKKRVQKYAHRWNANLLVKGHEDILSSPSGELYINVSGDPILTKGGTGDILAGYVAGLMAQGMSGFQAAQKAPEVLGKIGEYVAQQKGYEVSVKELLEELHEYSLISSSELP